MGLFSTRRSGTSTPLSRQPRATRTDGQGRTWTKLPDRSWSADSSVTRRAWRGERRMERDGSVRGRGRTS